jgi:hypothetical protein
LHDPLGYVDGGNVYEYVRCSPVGGVDPTGLRELNEKEKQIVEKLSDLAGRARQDDPELSKAIEAVITDYKTVIDGIAGKEWARLTMVNAAFALWADPNQAKDYVATAGDGIWKGKDKCNKYVGDALTVAGINNIYDPGVLHSNRYPTANEWADPEILGDIKIVWEVVPTQKTEGGKVVIVLSTPLMGTTGARRPEFGDIIVYPHTGDSGHVGIYLGSNLYISATSEGNHEQNGVVIKRINNSRRQIYRSPG